jgi:GcrA cell cycle regulator
MVDRCAWTAKQVEILRVRYAKGHSATIIAEALNVGNKGAKFTRCGVIGAARRRGFQSGHWAAVIVLDDQTKIREPRIRAAVPKKQLSTADAKAAALVRRDLIAAGPVESDLIGLPTSLRVTLCELEPNMCKWVLGDPKEDSFRYCGARTNGVPYCPAHHALVYEPPRNKSPERSYPGLR